MWQKVYAWSKKIHRWSMWLVLGLGGWMMLSGFLMHRQLEGDWIPKAVDMVFVRVWHNAFSQWFLVFLAVQMLTGLGMWLAPKMIARERMVTSPSSL